MVGRKLPPFAAVRAFEAVSRHLSIKEAASELCLSPSAVSHQIKALEDYLDTALFERRANKLRLTLTGRGYAGKMTYLLDAFDESSRQVRDAGSRPFRILCTPSFAARWLVPRLDRLSFGNRVRLRISDGAPDTNFASNDADLVIQWSDDPVPGVVTERLMVSDRFPVISPALKERENVQVPEDLRRVPLIHNETMDGWAEWFEAAGVEPPVFPRGPIFPHCELANTAAERGLGVALSIDATVRSTLSEGRLVRLFNTTIQLPYFIYSIAYPEVRRHDPMIRAFSSWIHTEAAHERVSPDTYVSPPVSG
jgi:LysR family glycine cleavage system transcriptional activator